MDPVDRFVAVATQHRPGMWNVEVIDRQSGEVVDPGRIRVIGDRDHVRDVAQRRVDEVVLDATGRRDRFEVHPSGWEPTPPTPPEPVPQRTPVSDGIRDLPVWRRTRGR